MTTTKATQQLSARGLDAHVTVGRVPSADGHGIRYQCAIYQRTCGRLGAPLAVGYHTSSRAKAVDAAMADLTWWQR